MDPCLTIVYDSFNALVSFGDFIILDGGCRCIWLVFILGSFSCVGFWGPRNVSKMFFRRSIRETVADLLL